MMAATSKSTRWEFRLKAKLVCLCESYKFKNTSVCCELISFVFVGWCEEEAGESKDHTERLFGLQWLHHISRECPDHTAKPRGAL